MTKTKRAFTLIELLVVVLIIGILSAVALPQYTAAVEKSRSAEMLFNLKHAKQTRDMFLLANPDGVSGIKPKDILELSGGTWSSDGVSYCTKNFTYDLAQVTGGEAMDVEINRCTPRANCSGCTDSPLYTISYSMPFDHGICTPMDENVAKRVCSGLPNNFELAEEGGGGAN